MWFFTILCCRVCELVQLVVDQFLTQSFKQLELKPSPKSHSFDKLCYQFSSCSLQTEISYAFCVLLSHILDFCGYWTHFATLVVNQSFHALAPSPSKQGMVYWCKENNIMECSYNCQNQQLLGNDISKMPSYFLFF